MKRLLQNLLDGSAAPTQNPASSMQATTPPEPQPRGRRNEDVLQRWQEKGRLRWWLVHGCERTGTTFITGLIGKRSKLKVSDWGLDGVLVLPEDCERIHFDAEAHLHHVSRNVLCTAGSGKGSTIDLVFKQASMDRPEYDSLVRMWGPPERTIFCFREPAGFINSAKKKFPEKTVSHLQQLYCKSMDKRFEDIGGEPFHYHSGLKEAQIRDFLQPLEFSEEEIAFDYRGDESPEDVTSDMVATYDRFRKRFEGA